MESLQLLIIEDEEAQIESYQDIIDQHNKKSSPQITPTFSKTFKEGQEALKSPFYDGAIIDLKLSNSEELEGRTLVESVFKKIRIPIMIYSGSIAQIDDIKENALLKKRLRTSEFTSVLSEIIGIYNTGITRYLRPDGSFDQKLTNIFWDHLSNSLDTWIEHNNQESLLRYILSHFQEYLEINMEGTFEEYHPHEVYIKPPIKKNLHTGDLIVYEEQLFLILTPACDIVIQGWNNIPEGTKTPIRKSDNLILVKVKDFDVKEFCKDKNGSVDKSKIKNFVTNSSYRFHYLPPSLNDNGYLVDFQDITTIPFNEGLERLATISSPFIKDIISRFSNYYSRQGQPTYSQDKIVEDLFKATK